MSDLEQSELNWTELPYCQYKKKKKKTPNQNRPVHFLISFLAASR